MKIEFTNKKLTVAIITRTRWSWRRFGFFVEYAEVEYHAGDAVWFYVANGLQLDGTLQIKIGWAVERQRVRWQEAALAKHVDEHPDPWKVWEPSMGPAPGDRL